MRIEAVFLFDLAPRKSSHADRDTTTRSEVCNQNSAAFERKSKYTENKYCRHHKARCRVLQNGVAKMSVWTAETGPASLDNYHATDFRLTFST